jgi:DNA-binding MarR family transcriptional regulator
MQEFQIWMSSSQKKNTATPDIYEQLTAARNYLRKADDFFARAAASNNTTFEHYQVLLAVHCLGDRLPLRALADQLVRDRTATGQLCRRMEQLGLIELAYEVNSHRPQLLVALTERGMQVLESITEEGLRSRGEYLRSLSPDKRLYLAEAVRTSWLEGLEAGPAASKEPTLSVVQPKIVGGEPSEIDESIGES